MIKRTRSWFATPIALLVVGVVLAGSALWRIVNRFPGPSGRQNSNTASRNAWPDSLSQCGDGVCQNVVCLSTNCPSPETPANCPADCPNESTAQNEAGESSQNNTNVSSGESAGLNFSISPQTPQQEKDCGIGEANMTPADAVAAAAAAGLRQGTGDVAVKLIKYTPPLDRCVWAVTGFEASDRGLTYLIIDATQEVWQKLSWTKQPPV
ncbi:MAG: hypothetical protein HY420_00865 [Candidatus Kerfeldbacteria bacterium]|nr:hypothetical protein [Candidatus Kerfeldbacteria bacterium]